MTMGWVSLAVGTEIGIMADSTFVAVALDVCLWRLVLAQWPVAENAKVDIRGGARGVGNRLVQGSESVARMNVGGAENAVIAEIPIGTDKTFMAYTVDVL